jgi:glycosyltransferase involved in cell wall biosynthesis
MTAKDAASTIRTALTSTLRALPRDADIIVLDDGSTDGTADVVDGLGDHRIRLIREGKSQGYAAARRRLFDQSDCETVAVMDADDITFPWRFRMQLPALRRADLVVSTVVRFEDGSHRFRPAIPLPISPSAVPLYLIAGCPLSHPTLIARRSVLEAVGGYREVVVEDYDLYLRSITSGFQLARTGIPVLAYRMHPGQTSRSQQFHARAQADLPYRAAYAMFVATQFGQSTADDIPAFTGDRIRAIVEAEIVQRRLGPLQRALVRRYLRNQLPSWG